MAGSGRRPRRTPPVPRRRGRPRESGQALVEFVALLPVLTAAVLAMGQGAVAGYAAWSAAGAARIGARAQALGADPEPAVIRELPAMLGHRARVRVASPTGRSPGRVTVHLRVPSIVPGLRFGTVKASAQLPDQAGA